MEAHRKPGLRSLVALAHVSSVPESIACYLKLGFEVAHSFTPPAAGDPSWVWLERHDARLMLANASAPIVAEEQAVLFYIYFDDVAATRSALEKAGVAVGPIEHPVLQPGRDPDGYVLTITHT